VELAVMTAPKSSRFSITPMTQGKAKIKAEHVPPIEQPDDDYPLRLVAFRWDALFLQSYPKVAL
jgi:hypothetical protein